MQHPRFIQVDWFLGFFGRCVFVCADIGRKWGNIWPIFFVVGSEKELVYVWVIVIAMFRCVYQHVWSSKICKELGVRNASFAKKEPEEESRGDTMPKEDLSLFERDLVWPEEGSICIDSNLQTAKYMVLHLMKRIHRGFNTWWKFNVAISREEKLSNGQQGYRPEMTGSNHWGTRDTSPMEVLTRLTHWC